MLSKRHGNILLIGLGGLGSAAAMALSGQGLARLRVADADTVALSNLPRQSLYSLGELGHLKVEAGSRFLTGLDPGLVIEPLPARLETVEAIADAARGMDLIIDATDNFPTRFAANDAALATGIPLVHGAATAWRGQLMTILPGETACLRCLFGSPPETAGGTCLDQGILAPLAAEIGWRMALEAASLVAGREASCQNRLLTVEIQSGRRRWIPLRRREQCPLCSPRPSPPGPPPLPVAPLPHPPEKTPGPTP
ncbi:MAG: HesA/MoeB/ThiF family protein [Magnetococcales bacterium]|nr:HesA/MoeB/ThiF family protein [Magnetococcales bacterium]